MKCRCDDRRILRPAIRAGRLRAVAGGAVGRDADGVARLSPRRAGRDPVVDRGDRSVSLFLLEVDDASGRRYLADVHLAGRLCRRRHQHRDAAAGGLAGLDGQVDDRLGQGRGRFRHRLRRRGVSLLRRGALEFDRPHRSGRRRSRLSSRSWTRAQAELQKTGATWIATTDYRTYAMLRWFFNGRVPVIQINERGRFMGFRDPGMDLIRGHTGLYVGARARRHGRRCGISPRRCGSRWSGSSAAGAAS